MPSAILLIAHGSRREEANRDLVELARVVSARRPEAFVEIAYLELAQPDIPTGARRCVERGATEVRMLPYFLSAGAHVAEDLEEFRRSSRRSTPASASTAAPPWDCTRG